MDSVTSYSGVERTCDLAGEVSLVHECSDVCMSLVQTVALASRVVFGVDEIEVTQEHIDTRSVLISATVDLNIISHAVARVPVIKQPGQPTLLNGTCSPLLLRCV